jgi:hypothetical protein
MSTSWRKWDATWLRIATMPTLDGRKGSINKLRSFTFAVNILPSSALSLHCAWNNGHQRRIQGTKIGGGNT